jgi:hypothetical protein
MAKPDYFSKPVTPARPDYFKDVDRPKQADWKRHEREIAERAGERQVPGSGNQLGSPGDTVGLHFLRDGKATTKAGMSLKAEWLRKIVEQALRLGKTPVLELRFEGAEIPVPKDWVLLPAEDFQEILDGSRGHYQEKRGSRRGQSDGKR